LKFLSLDRFALKFLFGNSKIHEKLSFPGKAGFPN